MTSRNISQRRCYKGNEQYENRDEKGLERPLCPYALFTCTIILAMVAQRLIVRVAEQTCGGELHVSFRRSCCSTRVQGCATKMQKKGRSLQTAKGSSQVEGNL